MKELIIGKKVKRVVLLDDEDFERITEYTWYAMKASHTHYAHRCVYENGRYVKKVLMHREVLNLTEYDGNNEVDHRNGNGLDNRRCNLRVCSRAENQRNRGKNKNNTSGFKGVYWLRGKWMAQIKVYGKSYFLGLFDTPEDAHEVYCKKARELHGAFFHSDKSKRRRKKRKNDFIP